MKEVYKNYSLVIFMGHARALTTCSFDKQILAYLRGKGALGTFKVVDKIDSTFDC